MHILTLYSLCKVFVIASILIASPLQGNAAGLAVNQTYDLRDSVSILIDRAFKAWHRIDMDNTVLEKEKRVSSCCRCTGSNGCSLVPSDAAMQRLSEGESMAQSQKTYLSFNPAAVRKLMPTLAFKKFLMRRQVRKEHQRMGRRRGIVPPGAVPEIRKERDEKKPSFQATKKIVKESAMGDFVKVEKATKLQAVNSAVKDEKKINKKKKMKNPESISDRTTRRAARVTKLCDEFAKGQWSKTPLSVDELYNHKKKKRRRAQISPDVISIPAVVSISAVVIISLFVSSGFTFAMLYFFHGTAIMGEKLLLAATVDQNIRNS